MSASRPGPAWCFVSLAVAGALLPEAALRWLYPDPVMMIATVAGPGVYLLSTVCAYYVSGKRKVALLLWLLAPLAFFRPLEFLYAWLLWTLRGGMV